MNWQRTFFLLPNLFTLASIFCGFFSITLTAAVNPSSPEGSLQLYQASLAICAGFFFDTFDGRVARMTKSQSALGMELDSLADVITFGAAPSLLVYQWGLTKFGLWGIFIAFTFCAAGALRLARFNVLALHETEAKAKPGKFIIGLPIPAAAAVVVSLVVLNHKLRSAGIYGPEEIGQGGVAVMVLSLSYLMVSRVRFRSFKDLTINRRSIAVMFLLAVASLTIYLELRGSFIFVFLMASYIVLGLSEEIIFFRRRRREAELAKQKAAPPPEDTEEDVLRELGAFDEEEQTPRGTDRLEPKAQ